jgi:hypothetical protein
MRRACVIMWFGACALLIAGGVAPASAALVPIGDSCGPADTTARAAPASPNATIRPTGLVTAKDRLRGREEVALRNQGNPGFARDWFRRRRHPSCGASPCKGRIS